MTDERFVKIITIFQLIMLSLVGVAIIYATSCASSHSVVPAPASPEVSAGTITGGGLHEDLLWTGAYTEDLAVVARSPGAVAIVLVVSEKLPRSCNQAAFLTDGLGAQSLSTDFGEVAGVPAIIFAFRSTDLSAFVATKTISLRACSLRVTLPESVAGNFRIFANRVMIKPASTREISQFVDD